MSISYLHEFIPNHPIKVTASDPELRYTDPSGEMWDHYHHEVWVTFDGRTMRVPFVRGIRTTFDSRDVLYSISTDARCAEGTFRDFCAEFGYSEDSINARRIYDAYDRTWHAIKRVFKGHTRAFYSYAEGLGN